MAGWIRGCIMSEPTDAVSHPSSGNAATGTEVRGDGGGAIPRRASLLARLIRHRLAMIGLGILVIMVGAAILGPLVEPYGPDAQNLFQIQESPGWAHPMGTDDLGRDVLSRVLTGSRISLAVGALSALTAVVIGTLLGALAGYAGGAVDNLLMRLTDVMVSIPILPLVIVVSSIARPSVPLLIIIIGGFGWMGMARLVRARLLVLKEQDYISAARAVAVPPWRIIWRHLLPNALAPIIVAGTLAIANAIILESVLSFFGLGVQPPTASWGNMLQNAEASMQSEPWLAVFPGVCIVCTVLSVNFLGDGLRDALDPRLRV
jgi:peptide/nickel transport system permease protein